MTSEPDALVFLNCYTKLKVLKRTDVDDLHHLIDQLNSLNIKRLRIDSQTFENMIEQMIPLIPQGNDHLMTKFCSLIYLFLNKHERNLSEDCVQKLIEFLMSGIQNCSEFFRCDILMGCAALLFRNGDKVKKCHVSLLGMFLNIIKTCKQDKLVEYYTFECILSLLSKNPEFLQKECFNAGFVVYLTIIKRIVEEQPSDCLSIRILINSLKSLQLLFSTKNMLGENIGELLGVLKCLLFYGLPGPMSNDFILHPTLPSPDVKVTDESQGESDSIAYPRLRKQKRVRRIKQKRTPKKTEGNSSKKDKWNDSDDCSEETPKYVSSSPSTERAFHDFKVISSDSEYSDIESSTSRLKFKSLQASVRQIAYLVLQAVVKNSDKKVIFGYWSSFLPDHPAIPGISYGQNVFTTILKDPVPEVRLGALVLLTEMLRGSKHFLSFADGKSLRHSSFTSLSSIIATIIEELHRCLLLALLSENTNLLLTQILKCYAVLCENTPYCKLKDEILLKVLKNVEGFLHHKDSQVQVAALIVFQFIVKSDLVPELLGNIIISPDLDSAVNDLNHININQHISTNLETNEIPWLVYICKKNIFSEEPLPTRIESVQLLSCVVGKYFNKLYSTLSIVEEVILFCLNNADSSLKLHGAKLLDVFGRCAFSAIESEMTEKVCLAIKKLWENVICGPFTNNITDTQKSLLSVCCDCLSTVPIDVFEALPERQQIFYVAVLLGLATDTNPNVRGAAIRCLGVYSLFPKLSQDFKFLSDISEILVMSVKDPYVNVRCKASWSLGKLSDALFENNTLCVREQITERFFYSTAMACVQYSKDCDKVRANSVRALGIFLHHLQKELIKNEKMPVFVKSATSVLQSALTANSMKVCWNVCYAFAKMLKNTELIMCDVIDLGDVLSTLLKSLESPNFKVRISATQALTVLESRQLYGKLFNAIWIQHLKALDSATNDVNFKEIKHQENLLDQVCYSLCRLAAIITVDDLSIIGQETLESTELLFTSMWKFGLHASVDKIEEVNNALEHLSILNAEAQENGILPVLQDILNQITIAFYAKGDE